MDNSTPNQSNWPNLNNQDSRPKPPPPPPPEITLRTMKSDLESLKQTGGANPTPKPFTPPEIKEPPLSRPTPPPQPQMPKVSPTNFPFQQKPPEKTVSLEQFSKTDELSKIGSVKSTVGTPPAAQETSKKKNLIILIIILLIVGIASVLLGYYVIFPKFFPSKTTTPITSVPETNQPVENNLPPIEQTPVTETPITHVSLVSTISLSSATISTIDLISLKNALAQQSQKTAPADSLAEIIIQDQAGNIISSNKILPLIFPELSSETLVSLEQDFTLVLYSDANGVWPAYTFKIKPEFTVSQIQNAINGIIETSSGIKNLFISDPGTVNAAGFKAGQTGGITTRYLTFSKAGASLNLIWTNNRFIISSSYNGAKKVLSGLK